MRKTTNKPVLSFVEVLVLTIARNNRNTADNIPIWRGITAVMQLLTVICSLRAGERRIKKIQPSLKIKKEVV